MQPYSPAIPLLFVPVQIAALAFPVADEADLFPVADEAELFPVADEAELFPVADEADLSPVVDEADLYPVADETDLYPVACFVFLLVYFRLNKNSMLAPIKSCKEIAALIFISVQATFESSSCLEISPLPSTSARTLVPGS